MFSKSNSQIHTLSHTHVNKFQTDKQKLRTARLCFIKKHAHFGVCARVRAQNRTMEQEFKGLDFWVLGLANKNKKEGKIHCPLLEEKQKKKENRMLLLPLSPHRWSHEIFIVE